MFKGGEAGSRCGLGKATKKADDNEQSTQYSVCGCRHHLVVAWQALLAFARVYQVHAVCVAVRSSEIWRRRRRGKKKSRPCCCSERLSIFFFQFYLSFLLATVNSAAARMMSFLSNRKKNYAPLFTSSKSGFPCLILTASSPLSFPPSQNSHTGHPKNQAPLEENTHPVTVSQSPLRSTWKNALSLLSHQTTLPSAKMSEAVLKNIEKELPKLQAELVKMKEAAPKSEAIVDLINYIAQTPEPFYGNPPPNNPWLKPAATPCCTVS